MSSAGVDTLREVPGRCGAVLPLPGIIGRAPHSGIGEVGHSDLVSGVVAGFADAMPGGVVRTGLPYRMVSTVSAWWHHTARPAGVLGGSPSSWTIVGSGPVANSMTRLGRVWSRTAWRVANAREASKEQAGLSEPMGHPHRTARGFDKRDDECNGRPGVAASECSRTTRPWSGEPSRRPDRAPWTSAATAARRRGATTVTFHRTGRPSPSPRRRSSSATRRTSPGGSSASQPTLARPAKRGSPTARGR
jgi:hypothetical protein